jgi:steroid delta-isomerase-like uncharacterized protein
MNREEWLGFAKMFMEAFPDGRHVFEDAFAAGDREVAVVTFEGTHTAPFMGIGATGRRISLPALVVDRVIEGRIVEHRGEIDTGLLMRQLGVTGDEQANRDLVARLHAAMDRQDWAAALALTSPDIRARVGSATLDRDAWVGMGKMFYGAFPDGRHAIEECLAVGDRVVTLATWSGTHRAEFQGLPATGRAVSVDVFTVDRIAEGRVVEHRVLFDAAAMMKQLTD